MHNLLERDFDSARPFSKLGTDVTEFKVAGSKAYLAPVYDMASKEIVAWDVSRSPDLGQQKRLLVMLAERLPAGVEPILHSDMGWQYQHQWWRGELERLGIRQSMSRKGNCLDNAATEQVFGHLKDEFYRGREFDSYEQFKRELDAYIIHWNTRRRQIRLEGYTPEEFRSMSLAVQGCILINNVQQTGRGSFLPPGASLWPHENGRPVSHLYLPSDPFMFCRFRRMAPCRSYSSLFISSMMSSTV